MHKKSLITAGKPIKEAKKALVLLHGRGSNSNDILRVASRLSVDDFALLVPQATHNTWYPYSFLVPPVQNQPWLNSALEWLKELTGDVVQDGIEEKDIYFLGFSQGACLTLEFTARNATRYGGVVAFTGGLIGDTIDQSNYAGDFGGTPIFISSGDPDPHIPVERVEESVKVLEDMNADVTMKIYDHRPHIISNDEIDIVNDWIFKS